MTTDLTVQPDKSLQPSPNQLQIDDIIVNIPLETLNKKIFNHFLSQAQNEVAAFRSSYDELKKVKNVLEHINSTLEKHLLSFSHFSLEYLKKIECFEYASEDLRNVAIQFGPTERWENLYKELLATEVSINAREEVKDEHRTLRRKTRNKKYWTTDTDGWGEKMMYNAATGMMHSSFNIMAKGASTLKASSEKKEIFKKAKEEFSAIFNGMCLTCYEFVALKYTEKGIPCASIEIIEQTNKKSKNIFKNAVDAGVDSTKLKQIIAECIALDCYNVEYYEALTKILLEDTNAKSNISRLYEFAEVIMPGQLRRSPVVNQLYEDRIKQIISNPGSDIDLKNREVMNTDDIFHFTAENHIIKKTKILYQVLEEHIRSEIDETSIADHISDVMRAMGLDIEIILKTAQTYEKDQELDHKLLADYYYQLILKTYKQVGIIDQIEQLVRLTEAVLNNIDKIKHRAVTDYFINILEVEVLNFPASLKTVHSVNGRLDISEEILHNALQGIAKKIKKYFPAYISNTCIQLEATHIPDIQMTFSVCGLDSEIETEIIGKGVIASINQLIEERISNEDDQIDFSVENQLNALNEFIITHFTSLSPNTILADSEAVKKLYRHQLRRIVFSTEDLEQKKESVLKLEELLPWIMNYHLVYKDLLIKEYIEDFLVADNSDISMDYAINALLEACGVTPETLQEQLHAGGKESSLKKLNKKQAAEYLKQLLTHACRDTSNLNEKRNCVRLLSIPIKNIETVYADLFKSFLISTLETEIEKFPAHVKNSFQMKLFLGVPDTVFEDILNDISDTIQKHVHPEIVRLCNELDSQRLAEIIEACNSCIISLDNIEELYTRSILETINQAIAEKSENKTTLVEFIEDGINSELNKTNKSLNIHEIWINSSAKRLSFLLWNDTITDSQQYQSERNSIVLSPSDHEQIDEGTYNELKQKIFSMLEAQPETENIGSKALKYFKQKVMKESQEPVKTEVDIAERIAKPLHWLERINGIIAVEDPLLNLDINRNEFLKQYLDEIESILGEFEKTEENKQLDTTLEALSEKSIYISRSSIWMYFGSKKPKNNFIVSLSGVYLSNGTSIPFSSIETLEEIKGISQWYIRCLLKSGEQRDIKNIKDKNLIQQLVFILNNGKQLYEQVVQGGDSQQFGSGEALNYWVDKHQFFEHICDIRLPQAEVVLRMDTNREFSREIFLPAFLEGDLSRLPETPEMESETNFDIETDSDDSEKKVFGKFKKMFSRK